MKCSFLLLILLSACGTYEEPNNPVCNVSGEVTTPLSPTLSGTWSGTGVLTGAPDAMFSLPMSARISLVGSKGWVRMTGLCPEETILTVNGCKNFAGWGGTIECTRSIGDCPDVRTTYTKGQVHGQDLGESISFVLEGTAEGCGVSQATQLVFTGDKNTQH